MIPNAGTTLLYTVKKGDSLYSIAQEFGVSIPNLIQINQLKSDSLSIGQQLRIPIRDEDNSDEFYGYTIYTVKPGDSLNSIAKANNTTVNLLQEINQLSSTDTLKIGQQLKIPYNIILDQAFDNDYLIYTVKAGDSLYSIAKKYNMSIDQLIQINDLPNNIINVGQQLKVISSTDYAIPMGSTCYGDSYVPPKYITYTVKPGDNLYQIANDYDVSVESIKKLNNLTSNELTPSLELKIKEDRL